MGTYIILNKRKHQEYAVFDYLPGKFSNNFYRFRDMNNVHNAEKEILDMYGTRLTVPEWIAKYGLPSCLQGVYDNDWIPF